jgi:hypothetical protein
VKAESTRRFRSRNQVHFGGCCRYVFFVVDDDDDVVVVAEKFKKSASL